MKRSVNAWRAQQAKLVAAHKAGEDDPASLAAVHALQDALLLMLRAWGKEATAGYLFELAARFAKGATRGPTKGSARAYDTRALAAVFWEARRLYRSDHACALAMARGLRQKSIGHSDDALRKAIERAAKEHPPGNALARMAAKEARAGRGRPSRLDSVLRSNKV